MTKLENYGINYKKLDPKIYQMEIKKLTLLFEIAQKAHGQKITGIFQSISNYGMNEIYKHINFESRERNRRLRYLKQIKTKTEKDLKLIKNYSFQKKFLRLLKNLYRPSRNEFDYIEFFKFCNFEYKGVNHKLLIDKKYDILVRAFNDDTDIVGVSKYES